MQFVKMFYESEEGKIEEDLNEYLSTHPEYIINKITAGHNDEGVFVMVVFDVTQIVNRPRKEKEYKKFDITKFKKKTS